MELLYINGNRVIPEAYLGWDDTDRTHLISDRDGFTAHWWHFELILTYPQANRRHYLKSLAKRRQFDQLLETEATTT